MKKSPGSFEFEHWLFDRDLARVNRRIKIPIFYLFAGYDST